MKLGERYDGVIAGINLQETAIGISEEGFAKAPGFSYLGLSGFNDAGQNPLLYILFIHGKPVVVVAGIKANDKV